MQVDGKLGSLLLLPGALEVRRRNLLQVQVESQTVVAWRNELKTRIRRRSRGESAKVGELIEVSEYKNHIM